MPAMRVENKQPQGPVIRPRFAWLSDRALVRVFLTPTLLLLLLVAIFPLLWSLYLSFTKYSVIKDQNGPTWIGFANFDRLLSDPEIWQRFATTARFVIPAVAIELVLGFGLAMLLNRGFKGRGLIMTLMLVPMMLTPLVVALFWRYMFQGDSGVINYWIHDMLGLPRVLWTVDINVAMWSLVIVDIWQWTPFIMLISLAGLSAVPKYLYEAAEVDRASGWFKFRHITLPLVTPLLLIAILFRVMDSYKIFDQAYALNLSGAQNQVLSIYLYNMAFNDFNTGKSSALGYIMLVVIIALANMLIRVLNNLKAEEA
jgi:multiple sugar transport system permease protein